MSDNQKHWAKLLDVAQFPFNLQRNKSTRKSPFEIVIGQQPITPHALATRYGGKSLAAFRFAKAWHKQAELARTYLNKASKRMKKCTDKRRRHIEFQVGDLVLVNYCPNS